MRSMKDKKFDDWAGVVVGVLILGILSIGGCQSDEEVAKREALKKAPIIETLGTFDGCVTKFVNRGRTDNSFYLAKCGNTTTTSQQYSSGRSTVTNISITQQIDQLQSQADELRLKQEAIKKLSPEERKALGIAEEPTM